MRRWLLTLLPVLLVAQFFLAQEPKPEAPKEEKKERGALSPKDEVKTFQLAEGFQIELAASEPNVVDPVAMAFDEYGRLFVAELRVYPNDGIAKDPKPVSQIVMLEDTDGDGVFDKSTVFADQLRIPNSIMPYDGGILVCDSPDIIFLKDTDNDGVADIHNVLYAGFDLSNIQMLPNALQWGLDNWVYGLAGNGGTVKYGVNGGFVPQALKGRGIRFKPHDTETLEATSGGGQFGLTTDDYGRWFTATNAQHLRQIVIQDRYLARNPYLPVPATTIDIAEHGAACRMYRISEFEPWRVERTQRRQKDPAMSKRLPPNELVPGGYATSTCSPLLWRGDKLPKDAYGDNFVCDPANNLVHRERLTNNGANFTSKRVYPEKEFLASKDTWFRPVCLTTGPDGSMYVADFYREVIETPLSLPPDIKEKYNLESRATGRIWRISATGTKYSAGKMPGNMKTDELVKELTQVNSWRRNTAQRILVERKDKGAKDALVKLVESAEFAPAKVHALWALHGLELLDDAVIVKALGDAEAGVRIQALVISEPRFRGSETIREAGKKLAGDTDKSVRYQAALSLGDCPDAAAALAAIWEKDAADPWISLAVLSSSKNHASEMLARQLAKTDANPATTIKLAKVAAKADRTAVVKLLADMIATKPEFPIGEVALIIDALEGSPDTVWNEITTINKDASAKALKAMETASERATNAKLTEKERVIAIRTLALGSSKDTLAIAANLLKPTEPQAVQLATVTALGRSSDAQATQIIISVWNVLSPEVRKTALDVLLSRTTSTQALLTAIDKGTVPPSQIDATRAAQLRASTNASVRTLANKVLAKSNADRQKVIEEYQSTLEIKGDATKGKAVFAKNCVACHKLENVGNDIGANLMSALVNKTPDILLIDIFDPSKEVDGRYLQYTLDTVDGKTLTGVIASETTSSVTIKVPEKGEITVLRSDIDKLASSAKSLMPEGLEKQISKDDYADLIAYLLAVRAKK